MTKLSIRPLTPSELHQASELMNSSYSIKKPVAYFQWRYFSKNDDLLWGAFSSKNLIGMIGTNTTHVGKTTAIVLTDMIVDQGHRMKGIFSNLLKQVIDSSNTETFLSFTNKSGKLALENNSWTQLLKIDSLVLDEAPPRMDRISDQNNSSKFAFAHTREWIKWRFDQNPIYKYCSIRMPNGLVITKHFYNPETRKKYGDIVFCKATNSFSAILKEAISRLKSSKVSGITTWALPHTKRYATYLDLGFKAVPQERYLCVLAKDKKSRILAPDLWDVHQADSEIY